VKDSNLRPWDYEPGGLRRRLSRRVSRRRPEPARLQGFGPVSKAVIRRWADRGFKSLPSVEPPVFARLLRVGLDRSVGFPGTARSSMLTRCNRRVSVGFGAYSRPTTEHRRRCGWREDAALGTNRAVATPCSHKRSVRLRQYPCFYELVSENFPPLVARQHCTALTRPPFHGEHSMVSRGETKRDPVPRRAESPRKGRQ
jgi:hypothetical protein